jgi:hypothetical protein
MTRRLSQCGDLPSESTCSAPQPVHRTKQARCVSRSPVSRRPEGRRSTRGAHYSGVHKFASRRRERVRARRIRQGSRNRRRSRVFRDRRAAVLHRVIVAWRRPRARFIDVSRATFHSIMPDRIEPEFSVRALRYTNGGKGALETFPEAAQGVPAARERALPSASQYACAPASITRLRARAADGLDLYVGNVHSGVSWVSLLAHRMPHCYMYGGLAPRCGSQRPPADLLHVGAVCAQSRVFILHWQHPAPDAGRC